MVRFVAVAVVVGAALPAYADDPPPPPIDEAIRRAAVADKPLVLEFSTEWCGACKQFEARTLPDTRVQSALGDIVFVRYDAEKAPGDAAAERYAVTAYPTFLVIDKQGVERARQLGGLEPGPFVDWIAAAPSKIEDEATVVARVKAHPKDATVQLAAARWYVDHALPQEAIAHYDVVSADRGASAAQRAQAWAASARLRRHVRWKQELVAEKLAVVRADPAHATEQDLAIATIDSGVPERDVRALFATVLAQADPDRVNNLIYSALAAGAKDEALAAAKKMTETLHDGGHLDTLAECYYVGGNQAEALKVEDQAIALSKDPTLAANRTRFAAGTGKAREVIALDQRVAALWKQLEEVDQPSAGPPAPPVNSALQLRAANRRKQIQAEFALAERLGQSCRSTSGSAEEAHVRVRLDAQGHVVSSVLMLEPGASDALRKCLTTEIASSVLPPGDLQVTLFITFRQLLHTP